MRYDLSASVINEIFRSVTFKEKRIKDVAIKSLISNVLNFPSPNENDIDIFERMIFFQNFNNSELVVPDSDWLHKSLSTFIPHVFSLIISQNENYINYIKLLTDFGIVYSPINVPKFWGIKHLKDWNNVHISDNNPLYFALMEIMTTEIEPAMDLITTLQLLKLVVELLAGCLIQPHEDSMLVSEGSSNSYFDCWSKLFDLTLNILISLNSVIVDPEFKESQKRKLLENEFFRGRNKPNVLYTPALNMSYKMSDNIYKQIKLAYDTHMVSLTKTEYDKFFHIGISILHSIEILLMCSTFDIIINKFFNLYLNLLCVSNKFPLGSSLCIKQLIYIFAEQSKWFSTYRLNDCALFYSNDSLFMEDPEYMCLMSIRCKSLKFIKHKNLSQPSSNPICTISLPDYPLISVDKYDSPTLSIFSFFVTLGFKYYFSHHSMAYHSLILDIVELFICFQVNYITLDPGSSFIRLTISKFNQLIKTPQRISCYFAKRIFRFWSLFHKIFSVEKSLKDEEWINVLNSTQPSSLLNFISEMRKQENDQTNFSVIYCYEVVLFDLLFQNDVSQVSKNSYREVEKILEILFDKYISHSDTFIILWNIIQKATYYEDQKLPIITCIVENIILNINMMKIPFENQEITFHIEKIFEILSFTPINLPEYVCNIFFENARNYIYEILNLRKFSTLIFMYKQFIYLQDDDVKELKLSEFSFKGILPEFSDFSFWLFEYELLTFIRIIANNFPHLNSELNKNHIIELIRCIIDKFCLNFQRNQPKCEHHLTCDIIRETLLNFSFEKSLNNPVLILLFTKYTNSILKICEKHKIEKIESQSILLEFYNYKEIKEISCHSLLNKSTINHEEFFNLIYNNIYNKNEVFKEKARILFSKIEKEPYADHLLSYFNSKNFLKCKIEPFISLLQNIIPDFLFFVVQIIDSITWIDEVDSLPVVVDLDLMFLNMLESQESLYDHMVKFIGPRFKNTYRKLKKYNNEENDFTTQVFKILSTPDCTIDEVKCVFKLIDEISYENLDNMLLKYEISSSKISYFIINNYRKILVDTNTDKDIKVHKNYKRVLKSALCLVNFEIKDIVNKIQKVFDFENPEYFQEIQEYISDLIKSKSSDNIYYLINSLEVLIFNPSILGIPKNEENIKYRDIYIFSLIVSSMSLLGNSRWANVIISAFNLLGFSLRISDNWKIDDPLEKMILAQCIKNSCEYFACTIFDFDKTIPDKLFQDILDIAADIIIIRSSCELSYLALKVTKEHMQNHESCSYYSLKFDQTYSLFTYALWNFIYNASKHKLYSRFVRVPFRVLPELVEKYEGKLSEISYIPVDLFDNKKDIKELLIRNLKLGYHDKQFYLECVMMLLSLINRDLDPINEIDLILPRLRLHISKAIVQLVEYMNLYPFPGDPFFSFLSSKLYKTDKFKGITRLSDAKYSFNEYSAYFLYRSWINVSKCLSILKLNRLDNELINLKNYTLNSSLVQDTYGCQNYLKSNHAVLETEKNESNKPYYGQSYFESIPILKLILEFLINSIKHSHKIYGDSSSKFRIMKCLSYILNFLAEDLDFCQILDELFLYQKNFFENELFLKYYIHIVSVSIALLGDHKIKKKFLLVFEGIFNMQSRILKFALLETVINIIEHRPQIIECYKYQISVLIHAFLQRLIENKSSETEKHAFITICNRLFHFDSASFINNLIYQDIIEKFLPLASNRVSNSFHLSLYIASFNCIFQIMLIQKDLEVMKRILLNTLNQTDNSEALIDLVSIYLSMKMHNWDDDNNDVLEPIEIASHLMQKIQLFDYIVSYRLSSTLESIIINFIDVENILNKIINIICTCNFNRNKIFIKVLYHCLEHLNASDIQRPKDIWLTHSLNIIKKQPKNSKQKKLVEQLLACFYKPQSKFVHEFTLYNQQGPQFTLILFNFLTVDLSKYSIDEIEQVEVLDQLKLLLF